MSNIHHLPEPGHRGWRVYEKTLRELLAEAGVNAPEMEHVVGVVKATYLKHATLDQIVPDGSDPQAVFDALNAWMRRVCSELLMSIAEAELRAYRAERVARN